MSGVLVGTSPFARQLTGSTITTIVVPLKVNIGTAVFDPSAPNSCDGNVSAFVQFRQSPLANDVPNLTMNGINVGDVQFINGLRRAEFWSTIQGSRDYQNEMSFSYANPYELTADVVASHGITAGDGCSRVGILSTNWLDQILQQTVLPALASSGAISSNAFVLFLLKNTVQSDAEPPSLSSCCILGYHSAFGSSFQTYSTVDWETTGSFTGLPTPPSPAMR